MFIHDDELNAEKRRAMIQKVFDSYKKRLKEDILRDGEAFRTASGAPIDPAMIDLLKCDVVEHHKLNPPIELYRDEQPIEELRFDLTGGDWRYTWVTFSEPPEPDQPRQRTPKTKRLPNPMARQIRRSRKTSQDCANGGENHMEATRWQMTMK